MTSPGCHPRSVGAPAIGYSMHPLDEVACVTLDARNGAPMAAYREQTVEIGLGPKRSLRKRQHRHPDASCGLRLGRQRRPAASGQGQAA